MFACCPVQLTKWLASEKSMQCWQAFEALVHKTCYLLPRLVAAVFPYSRWQLARRRSSFALAQQPHLLAEARSISGLPSGFTSLRLAEWQPPAQPRRVHIKHFLAHSAHCNETQVRNHLAKLRPDQAHRLQETPGGDKDVPVCREQHE